VVNAFSQTSSEKDTALHNNSYQESSHLTEILLACYHHLDCHCLWSKHAHFKFGLHRGQLQVHSRNISALRAQEIMTNLPSPELALSDTASQPDDQHQLISIPKTSAASQPSNAMKQPIPPSTDHPMASPDILPEKAEKTSIDARTKISNLLKDKEQEWAAVAERKGPLRLLDLPMDVLKEIVKEVNEFLSAEYAQILIFNTGHSHK
jgi:hypothetical protein